MAAKDTGPLDYRIAIVDKAGRATPEFQRRWETQRANNGLIGSVTLGSGPPPSSPAPSDGQEYVDISATPYVVYFGSNGIWHQAGVQKFTQLSDVPTTYAGSGTDLVQVNVGETALQFIPLNDVQSTGFSFNVGGRPAASEVLGTGVWPTNVEFDNTLAATVVSFIPAAATAVFNITMLVGLVTTTIGTITFAAASRAGVLSWSAPITITAGNTISLIGPSVQDSTLANITGLVYGKSV